MRSCRALVIDGPGRLAIRSLPVAMGSGECLVRVLRAGICGTDLQLLEGYAGFHGVPGHEFVGVVEEAADPGDRSWLGRRVVGEINVGCGRCGSCLAGVKEHCAARTVVGIRGRDGAFAEYVALPAANLHEVPDSLDDEAAVFVEPLAAACRILEQTAVAPEARVAVLGDGRMGLLVAQVLRTATPHVVLFGRHQSKLDVARGLGIEALPQQAGVSGSSFDIVVDATGRPAGLRDALALVCPRGTVVLKSTFHGEAAIPSWPIVVHEVTIVGSRCGPFSRALDLLAAGAVAVRPLVSSRYALGDYEAAFSAARQSLKVLFTRF